MSDQIDVRYVAKLARINLDDAESQAFQEQLVSVLGYIEKLKDADVEGIEPMSHAAAVQNRLREDVSRPGIGQDEFLKNAPESALGQIRVPKVVDA